MTTLEELIEKLKWEGVLSSRELTEAFRAVDRKDFLLSNNQSEAYANHPFSIGHGQTNSQPYTVAFMLDLLEVEPGQDILDIGSGSGWTTAILAYLTGSQGRVLGLERQEGLVTWGRQNLEKYDFPWAAIEAAGPHLGAPGKKFDRILVSASADHMPMDLYIQLNNQGIMVIPVRNSIFKVKKVAPDAYIKKEFPGFVFVPLIS